MAHKWDDNQRDDSSTDPEQDFESFLRRKVDECVQDVPVSQLTPTVPETQEKPNPADTAGPSTSESPTSPLIPEENPQSEHLHASDAVVRDIISRNLAVETATELEIREHPKTGAHVVEHQVVLTVDAEWVRISNESYTMAVVDLSCEKIIERIHDLNRLRFLIPAQQFGLQNALEELLKSRNSEDRAKLTALMSENYRKLKARSTPSSKTPREKKDKAVGKGASMNASSKGQKLIKSLHGLGFDKGFAETKAKEQGLFDAGTAAYMEKIYGA